VIVGASANSWKYCPVITGESSSCSTLVTANIVVDPAAGTGYEPVLTGESAVPTPHPTGTISEG